MPKPAPLPQPLQGIVPPMITPLADAQTLDRSGLVQLVEHLIAGGVSGIFVLGTTGEGPSLDARLRRQLIDEAADLIAGRVPLLVGITDTALIESVDLAEYAADAGAAAVVVAPPPYFPIGQADLLAYIERLAAAVPLPLFLYNMPSHTKLVFDVETVRRAMELPKVVGVKDSSGDLMYFQRLARLAAARPGFTLLMGPEELLLPSVLAGGHGGVCGGANLNPALYVALYRAAAARDLEAAAALEVRVHALAEAIYSLDRASAGVIKGLKTALSSLGFCAAALAEPLHGLGVADENKIRARLAALGLDREALTPAATGQPAQT